MSNRLRSGERHRCHCLSISRPVVITRLRLIEGGDDGMGRRVSAGTPYSGQRLYLWQNFVDGALIVFWKIDLDPRHPPRAQRVQRMVSRKLEKRTRRPILHGARTDQGVDVFNKQSCSGRTEFYYADVFTVGVKRIDLFRNVDDELVSDLDLHLFVAERIWIRIGYQQSIRVIGFQQVGKHLGMKQHVGVEHDETVQQMFARHPQRVQTARLGELNVLDEADLVVAFFANAVRTETNHNHDLSDVQTSKRVDLPVQERRAADVHQTLGLYGRAVEPGTFSCCEYDCFHEALFTCWGLLKDGIETCRFFHLCRRMPAKNQSHSSSSNALAGSLFAIAFASSFSRVRQVRNI